MNAQLINIDSGLQKIESSEVTGELIDTYVSLHSFGFIDQKKTLDHLLELVTCNPEFWQRLVFAAHTIYWLKSRSCGVAIFEPSQDCGFTRAYYYRGPGTPISMIEAPWKLLESDQVFFALMNSLERSSVYCLWKKHKEKVNALPTEFAHGRLDNTDVKTVWIVTKGNGCAVCGKKANYQARTTLSDLSALLLTISLCEEHQFEATQHPCVLVFFGSLFMMQLDVGDLVKLDHIPDELISPICEIIGSYIGAKISELEKREKGWHVKLSLSDGWYWILRMNTMCNYAYVLFDPNKKERHKIDSAAHHPEIPFGPDHQHYKYPGKKKKLAPSFTYGVPLLDFPILINARNNYE